MKIPPLLLTLVVAGFLLLVLTGDDVVGENATCSTDGTCEASTSPTSMVAKYVFDATNWTIRVHDVVLCCFGEVLPLNEGEMKRLDARDLTVPEVRRKLDANVTGDVLLLLEEPTASIVQESTAFENAANVARVRPVSLKNFALHSAYFQEFDQVADSLSLGRSRDVYNMSKRMEYIAGMQFTIPLSVNDSSLPTVSGFLASSFTPGVEDDPSSRKNMIAFHEVRNSNTYQTYLMSKGKDAILQARVNIVWSSIRAVRGEATVILVPSSRIGSLRLFAGIHPLRRQSQIDFLLRKSDFPNADVNVTIWQPIRLTAASPTLVIPPYTGILTILHESETIVMMKSPLESDLSKARMKAASKLPRYFQPNALKGQPLFFGLYALAVYADTLLKTTPTTRRTAMKHLYYSTNRNRWGMYGFRRGHADDPDDGASGAVDSSKNVLDECDEMAKQPKEMMMDPGGRAEIEEEVRKGAEENRELILGSCKRYTRAACVEMLLDQVEYAIANTLGAAAARAFFSCYFSAFG